MATQPHNNNNKRKNQKESNQLNTYAKFSGIAVQMFAIIVVGTYIGFKLDENYPNEHNLYTLAGSLSSVIISIIYIIKRIIAVSKDDTK